MKSALSKITAARVSLLRDNPFFGYLALNLKVILDPTCKTAWTDGRSLGFNPEFAESLSHDRLTAVVGHEVMHCACGHPWRRAGRSMPTWNIACDKAINEELVKAGFTLPDGALYPSGDESGKSAEWIFARMRQEDKPGQGQGQPQPGQGEPGGPADEPDPLGEVRDAPTGPDAQGEPAPSEQMWKERAASALTHAKLAGKVPGGMERVVKQALRPRVDVRSLLLRFFTDRAASDYSWTRPNTRYLSQGLYLPSLESRSLGEVAIMVDTSGSIDDTALGTARAILESVIEECNPSAVTLYFADAEVKHVERIEAGAPITWTPKGGGGTDFRPALEAIEIDGGPVCIVCITDLEGTFPDAAPAIPVLWLSTSERITAPFGETVYIDE
jgi:predicted metal-dependent peptidase